MVDKSRPGTKRARTRAALVQAAADILAEAGTGASVATIASRAGTATGTFYLYFTDKSEAFQAAAVAAMQDWDLVAHDPKLAARDPLAALARQLRLLSRLPEISHRSARIVVHAAPEQLLRTSGYRAMLWEDVNAAIRTGDIDPVSPEVAQILIVGTGINLLSVRLQDGSVSPKMADGVVSRVLIALGASAERAAEVCNAPLPLPR